MTIIIKEYNYRNSRNNATLIVQNYWIKFEAVSFWRVLIKYDNKKLAQTIRTGLLSKPKISNYLFN